MNQASPQISRFEFLTEDEQKKVLHFTSVSDMDDIELATLFMEKCSFNINLAMQFFLDGRDPSIDESSLSRQKTQNLQFSETQYSQEESKREYNDTEALSKDFEKYLHKKKIEDEQNSGIIGTSKKIGNSISSGMKSMWNIIPLAIRGERPGGERFIAYFSKKYPKLAKNLDFRLGTIAENTVLAHKEKKPLLLYAHLDGKLFEAIPKKIFTNPQLLSFIKNKFALLGFLTNTDGAQEAMKYMSTKELPCFAVFRLNIADEVNLLQHITLTSESEPNGILEGLKNLEELWRTSYQTEELIKRDVRKNQHQIRRPSALPNNIQVHQSNAPLRRTSSVISEAERVRLEESRLLREQQEEDFKRVEELMREQEAHQLKEKRELEEVQARHREEENAKRLAEQQKKQHKEIHKEECRKRLPEEPTEFSPNIILMLFRLPNGERVTRKFLLENKVMSLYDYIDTLDVKFEDTDIYDLIQPMPFVCLEDRDKTINDYFEGSQQETVVVREKM